MIPWLCITVETSEYAHEKCVTLAGELIKKKLGMKEE